LIGVRHGAALEGLYERGSHLLHRRDIELAQPIYVVVPWGTRLLSGEWDSVDFGLTLIGIVGAILDHIALLLQELIGLGKEAA